MPEAAYKSYKEYTLDIGDAGITFFTDTGAISDSEEISSLSHTHEFCELFYVTRGEITIKTNENTYCLKENDAALIPIGTMHQTIAAGNTRRIVLSFVVNHKKTKTKEKNYFREFNLLTKGNILVFHNFAGADSFRRFARYYYGSYSEKHQLILSCLHEIIILTKEFATKREPDNMNLLPDSILYRNYIISDYIENSFDTASLTSLSELLHLSCQQTHRIIKNLYGKSFGECIMDVKMKNATELITNTNLSFGEISVKLGYKCVHSFFTAFKKYYKKTPGSLR